MKNETKNEIYPNRNKTFEREQIILGKDNIDPKNKELITLFQNKLFSKGSGFLRVAKLSAQLRNICRFLDSINPKLTLDKVSKTDIVNLVSYINRIENYSDATKSDYRRALKQFYVWFKDEDNRINATDEQQRIAIKKLYDCLEKDISIDYKKIQADPNTIISEQDIEQVIEFGARTPREKAFISCLHETGCRVSEFLNIKIGNIAFLENHAEILLPDGKTGKRIIYISKSIPYLLKYLDVHPFKNNHNAYLWLSEAGHNKNAPMLHKGSQKLIDRCFERAKQSKKHNFHWFRHSRATILAPKIPEVLLCKYMGWTIGSRQVRNYVHLCVKQLEDAFLSMNGIKSSESAIQTPIRCICGTLNHAKERYCFKCYKPLSVDVVIQDKELVNTETNKAVQFLMEISKNPQLLEQFEKFKKEYNQ